MTRKKVRSRLAPGLFSLTGLSGETIVEIGCRSGDQKNVRPGAEFLEKTTDLALKFSSTKA
jgi:hypothetical protein